MPAPARGGAALRRRGRPGRPRGRRVALSRAAAVVVAGAGATPCPAGSPPAAAGWRPPGRSARWWSRAFALENPVRDLRPPALGRRGRPGGDRRARSSRSRPAAVRRMCEAAAQPGPLGARTHALVEVLYGCGLRASEAAGLDLSPCHLDDPDDPFVTGPRQGRQAARGRRAAPGADRPDRLPARRPPRAARPRPAPPARPGAPPRRGRGLPGHARAAARAGARSGRS